MKNQKNNVSMNAKLFKIMLIFSLFFISATVRSHELSEYNQTKKFTLDLKNVPVKSVFKYIEKESEYVFFYYADVINESQLVNIKVSNLPVNELLNELFKNMPVSYTIKDRQILLKNKEAVPTTDTQQSKGKKLIQGLVKDERGETIIGATIKVEGTTLGTTTDMDGLYNLSVPSENSILVVSYIGYSPQEIKVGDRQNITITLKEDAKALEEVVVTAFGVGQKKNTFSGAVTQIRPSELKVPSSNLSTSFAGRLSGVIAVQRSGEPGADGANFWIRGKSTFSGATGALIIIDGMQASSSTLNALDPEVIESFSILKDATATAMYGTLGANGVMVVTTKRGDNLSKPIVNFRVEGSMSSLSEVPSMVDGARYMDLYNEAAARSDQGNTPYTTDKIEKTRLGRNSTLYPNIDWYDELFKKNSFGQKVNFNIRGGGAKMDYFMSVSVKHNDGNLKSLSKDYFSYNNNINVTRYDFVNNLNLKVTRSTKISLGLNVGLYDYNGPEKSAQDYFGITMNANPVDFPIKYPGQQGDRYVRWGGKTGGASGVGYPNPMAELVTGSRNSFNSTVTANLKLEQKLDVITEGLKFAGSFYFRNYSNSGSIRTAGYNQFELNTLNPDTEEYDLRMVGTEQNTTLKTSAKDNTGDRKIYIQAVLDYNRRFNEKHDVNAMFLYNQEQYNTNIPTDLFTSLPQRKQGIAGRVSYAYADRYMAEANFGYNGSENFAKGNRFGFFPSIGVGYNISMESFWDPIRPVVSNLKLRASWGLVGNDNTGAGRFAYMEDIVLGGSSHVYSTGIAGSYTSNIKGPMWNRLYNPGLTWEVGEKINFGVDAQLFNSLNINFELFRETRKNIFQERVGTIPGILGTGKTKIYGNLGKMQNQGLELALDYNKQVNKDLFISFKGTFTFAQNKVLERDEPDFQLYPNLSVLGGSTGRHLIYIANGLFPDQETIDNSPKQSLGGVPLPGDIWYQDVLNAYGEASGTITTDDRVYMGFPADPEIVYGFGPSIKYKNWDASFFFQGVGRTSLLMSNFFPFGDLTVRGVLDFVADDCWTEANPNPNAAFPRLKISNNENNSAASSYWLRDASFIKLKDAEVGYTYKKMRFYISGNNLLTFSPFKYWDPEMGGGNGLKYPTQRTFNIGFQMTIN